MPRPHPYRSPECPTPAFFRGPADPLAVARLVSKAFLLVWALLRVAICTTRGLDFEGFVALVIVVAAVKSLTKGKP
jgi:hypothetical protein